MYCQWGIVPASKDSTAKVIALISIDNTPLNPSGRKHTWSGIQILLPCKIRHMREERSTLSGGAPYNKCILWTCGQELSVKKSPTIFQPHVWQ